MYAWIFRLLPNPLWLKILISLALVCALIMILAWYLFPWLEDQLNLSNVTLDV